MEFDNSRPIWLQLTEEFARLIAVGTWQPGTKLPGVRDLAVELGVNPNTVQRALAELERDGLCRAERTSGRYVTDDPERIDQLREELVGQHADSFIDAAIGLGLTQTQSAELISRRWTTRQASHEDTPFTKDMPGGGL